MFAKDTIAAISTAAGAGAIGIVRISGPRAEEIGRRLFTPRNPACPFSSHRLYSGDIHAPGPGAALDEGLFVLMRGPRTFTGEDTVELHCHGGPVILQCVLEAAVAAGARPAEPGEFTRRAFLNGRLDLSQAEAVRDLVTAKAEGALGTAVSQLKGALGRAIEPLREGILQVLASLEASIDFAEDDIEAAPAAELAALLEQPLGGLRSLLDTYREGKILREGIRVVIAGRTNVGKSSLFNRLLGEKRAIVTPVAGTTRDFIEETISLRGLPVRLTDTAGIRETDNPVEKEGLDFAREKLLEADVVIVLLDGSEPLSVEDRDILEANRERNLIVAVNKKDLPGRIREEDLRPCGRGASPVRLSAKYGEGIDDLKQAIHASVSRAGGLREECAVLTTARHKAAVEEAAALVGQAKERLEEGRSPELAAFDLRQAMESLEEITGRNLSEEILDRIFETFCIGK